VKINPAPAARVLSAKKLTVKIFFSKYLAFREETPYNIEKGS
jgi:hypothetical protein